MTVVKGNFPRRRDDPGIIALADNIINNAISIAISILSEGEVTISRDIENRYDPYKLLLKHLDERVID